MLLRMGEFFSTILSLFLKNLVALHMRQGIVTGELDKKELNEQGLIALAMGVA